MKHIIVMIMLAVCLLFAGCKDPIEEGMEFLQEEQYEEAQSQFEQGIEKGKNLGEAYLGLGICYWEEEEYQAALETFKLAVENGVEKTAALYQLMGQCELKLSHPGNAAIYFEQGQECADVSEELKQEMAWNEIAAYERMQRYEDAKAKLEIYMDNYPEDELAAKEWEFLVTQSPKAE